MISANAGLWPRGGPRAVPPGPVPTATIRFGALTPAGAGAAQVSDVPNGTYGRFLVTSGVMTPISVLVPGSFDVGGVTVTVEAAAISVASLAEIGALTSGSLPLPRGTTIYVRHGTYDTSDLTFAAQAVDVTWQADDPTNRPVFTHWSIAPGNASGGSLTFDGIDFDKPYPTDEVGFWGPAASTIHSILVGDGSGLTALTIRNGEATGNLAFWVDGGRMSHNNPLVHLRGAQNFTLQNYTIRNTRAGVTLDGVDGATITGCTFIGQFADPVVLQNASADLRDVVIALNHFQDTAGDTSTHHYDVIQFQPTSGGFVIDNVDVWGNTMSAFQDKIVSQVDPSHTKTFNVYSTSGPLPASEHGQEARFAPGGNITITMPPANKAGEQYCCRYTSGSGVVTFDLAGTDTYDGSPVNPTMSAAGDFVTFVSDGAGNWERLLPGYRAWFMGRRQSFTAGALEDRYVTKLNAIDGPVVMTLPDNGAQTFHVQREDATGNVCRIVAAPGDTITHRGVTITQIDFVQGYGINLVGNGAGNWTATEDPPTAAFLFGNAGPYSNVRVHGNIIIPYGPASRIEQDIPGMRVFNNTILRLLYDDENGDGVIGIYEHNNGATAEISLRGADSYSFRNASAGYFVSNFGSQDKGSIFLNIGDVSTLPAPMTAHWAGNARADFRPRTRAEVIAAALAQAAGPLDGTFIGALGTTPSNGYFNATAGAISTSLPLPTITAMDPIVGSDYAADGPITLTFDQFIEAGTGNIVIFDVTAGTVARTIPVASAVIADDTLSVTPSPALTDGNVYAIRLDAGVIVGIYGTGNAAITGNTWTWTADAGLPSDYEVVVHDGDYLLRTGAVAGPVAGPWTRFLFGCNLYRDGGGTGLGMIFRLDGVRDVAMQIASDGQLRLTFGQSSLRVNTLMPVVSPRSTLLISVNSAAATAQAGVVIYKDGVAVDPANYTSVVWVQNTTIDTIIDMGVLADDSGGTILHGRTGFVYADFPATLPDLSSPTERAKFSPGQILVGSKGHAPTGAQPFLFMSGPASEWNAGTNHGYCGAFTTAGAFANL